MTDGAAREASGLSEECVCGKGQERSRNTSAGLRWSELLSRENGGPGDSPGRNGAIERAKARTAERYALHGKKKAKGSKKAVKNELGRPRTRELGL